MIENNKGAASADANKLVNELIEHMTRGFSGAWHMQDVSERRRRLAFVSQMAVVLEGIKKDTVAMSIWADWAIEAVITGDLNALKTYGVAGLSEAHLTWNYRNQAEARRLVKAYAPFRELAEQAYLTALPRETV